MAPLFSPGFRRYFFNTSWLLGEKLLRLAMAFFVGIYLARLLGPERYGLLQYAISFVALFSALLTLCHDEILVRDLLQKTAERDSLLGSAFVLKLAGALALIAVAWVGQGLSSSDPQTTVLVMIIAVGMLSDVVRGLEPYYQAQVRARIPSMANGVALVASSLLKVALVFLKADLVWLALAVASERLVASAVMMLAYRREHERFTSWKISYKTLVSLLSDSLPLMLTGMLILIYMRIDQVMIKEMLGSREVGIFAVAVRISEAWYMVPLALTQSVFPAIIKAKADSQASYMHGLQKLFDLLVALSLLVAVPMTILGERLITLLFGQAYAAAGGVLVIHIWTGLFVSLGVVSAKWIVIENLQRIYFLRSLAGVIINVILNLILIPRMGIKGAAIATLVSQATATFLYDAIDPRTRHIFLMKLKALLPIRLFSGFERSPTGVNISK